MRFSRVMTEKVENVAKLRWWRPQYKIAAAPSLQNSKPPLTEDASTPSENLLPRPNSKYSLSSLGPPFTMNDPLHPTSQPYSPAYMLFEDHIIPVQSISDEIDDDNEDDGTNDDEFFDAERHIDFDFDNIQHELFMNIEKEIKPRAEGDSKEKFRPMVLPTPPTIRETNHAFFRRLSFFHESIPIFIALLIATATLVFITLPLFVELEKAGAELYTHYRSPLSEDGITKRSLFHSRSLTSIQQPTYSPMPIVHSQFRNFRYRYKKYLYQKGIKHAINRHGPRTGDRSRKRISAHTVKLPFPQGLRIVRYGLGRRKNYSPSLIPTTQRMTISVKVISPASISISPLSHENNELIKSALPGRLYHHAPNDNRNSPEVRFSSLPRTRHQIPPTQPPIPPWNSIPPVEETKLANFGEVSPLPFTSGSNILHSAPASTSTQILRKHFIQRLNISPRKDGSESSNDLVHAGVILYPKQTPVSANLIVLQKNHSVGRSSQTNATILESEENRNLLQNHTVSSAHMHSVGTENWSNLGESAEVLSDGIGKQGNVGESVEIWHLPDGKHLCRFPNSALAEDGRVFVPAWMRKHHHFISNQCGLTGVVYGIKEKDNKIEIEPSVGNVESYMMDLEFKDRDLFSPESPRCHMAHFVTDIIKPLIAVEALLGSGRTLLMPYSILHSGPSSKPEPNNMKIGQLKPALVLSQESWERPPTDWVRSFANFFEHPALGFVLVPLDKWSEKGRKVVKLRLFNSIMSTDVNPYEPSGLFGISRNNVMFAMNGISRELSWSMNSLNERPCRISITALTRSGSRALLGLDELERFIKLKAAAENISADFRVVDFSLSSFDDQIKTMQDTNVLIATHGAGNTNVIFMRPGATFVEVFPFSYKAGPFDGFAKIFGLEYFTAMSAPQTAVFKTCMTRHEKSDLIRDLVFEKWDEAVQEEQRRPWVHRLEFEKEFGEPGKSQGLITRGCVRLQQLQFDTVTVTETAIKAGKAQCNLASLLKK